MGTVSAALVLVVLSKVEDILDWCLQDLVFSLLWSLCAPAGKAAVERWVKEVSCWRGKHGAHSSKCGFREMMAAAMPGA